MDRRMRGCFLLILRRRASSDFESRYEWPRGIVRIGEGAEGGSYEIEGAGGYTMVWIGCVSILALSVVAWRSTVLSLDSGRYRVY